MNLLIAEDDNLLRKATRFLMSRWGFECDTVSNGKEALARAVANEGKYDLCMMNIDMPGMNGFEAAKAIRQQTRYFPIMGTSADSVYRESCREFGIDDFVTKPYMLNQLFDKIRELTVKSIKIHRSHNKICLIKELPVDSDELRELKELDKQGLAKFSLVNANYKFVVHKNLQNKISHDFIAKGKKLSEFLDRSPNDPGIIHLYADNLQANKRHIFTEMLEELAQKEDEEFKDYTTKAEYPEENDSPDSNV